MSRRPADLPLGPPRVATRQDAPRRTWSQPVPGSAARKIAFALLAALVLYAAWGGG